MGCKIVQYYISLCLRRLECLLVHCVVCNQWDQVLSLGLVLQYIQLKTTLKYLHAI